MIMSKSEVALLKEENEKLRGRNFGGRKKHDKSLHRELM